MKNWKTTIQGVLSFAIATLMTLMTFQAPAALMTPQASKFWLYFTAASTVLVSLCKVWLGLLQTDAQPAPPATNTAKQGGFIRASAAFTLMWIAVAMLILPAATCTPIQKSARNAIAGAQGVIVAAQAKYGPSCNTAPTQAVCVQINKAISIQNAAVTAVEAYCGWSTVSPPADPSAKCVPVASAEAALSTAVLNLNQFIVELKGAF